MAINQISTANTFQQWLTATQSLIAIANNLTDGVGGTFYANTDITIDGNLIVTGNITLEAVGYDNLDVSGNVSVGETLTVTGNTTLSANLTVLGNTTLSANLTVLGNTNLNEATITTLTGLANTNIYNAIANSGTTTAADALAFAIALG
jgi:predicted acyltransferase (DUF342 family)